MDSPPRVPPKDEKSSAASTSSDQSKPRRLSIGNFSRPKSTPTSDTEGKAKEKGNNKDKDLGKEKGKEKEKDGLDKVKEMFAGLGSKKKSSSRTGSEDSKTLSMTSGKKDDARSDITAPKNARLLPPTGGKGTIIIPSPLPATHALTQQMVGGQSIAKPHKGFSTSSSSSNATNMFHQAVANAQQKVDRLQTTTTVLKTLAAGLAVGTAWMPGVGEAVGVVVSMLMSAEQITIGRVAALRLVERSATVLEAVEDGIIEHKGLVSVVMQSHITQLISHLNRNNKFLFRLSERSFLKLYLHSDETARQIAAASEDLEDFIKVFQKLDEARASDQKMLEALSLRSEAQQEAIKTLQRTLDQMLIIQQAEYNSHHPTSPLMEIEASRYFGIESPVVGPTAFALPQAAVPTQFKTLGSEQSYGSISSSSSDTSHVPDSKEAWRNSDSAPKSVWESVPQTPGEKGPHREFFEKALDVLRRTSDSSQAEIPDWTITNLEISHDEQITHDERIMSGYFSIIWRGRWQGLDVAIKELTPMADRQLFVKEVEVWRRLKSDRILPFYGASSTTGPPPWFLVSPYMKNGNILTYLNGPEGSDCNKLAMIHEMAQAMEYLHSRDILHGDFKASNVLINDDGHAIICDFGLSQLKMDFTSKSQDLPNMPSPTAGTLRWQSPERLAGGVLTRENDVYAWAMAVYEVITGMVPFGYIDDSVVRRNIRNGVRPARPENCEDTLWSLMDRCWAQDPAKRPTFEHIVEDLSIMYTPAKEPERKHTQITTVSSSETDISYTTASEGDIPEEQQAISPASNMLPLPEPSEWSSSSGSIASIPPHLESQPSFESDRAERHYRHYLQHEFDDRLTIALWFPSAVPLGSVGYIRHGQFVHLLDAHMPPLGTGDLPPVPYLDEFSSLQTLRVPVNVKGATERGLEMVATLTKFIRSSGETSQKAISRKVTFPLRPGMKQAALIVENGQFEIFKSYAESRAYLIANIEWILRTFGDQHQIAKEDVIMVVGTLTARNYAMIVSNFAPRTKLCFNVHSASYRDHGEPWGTWAVNHEPLTARSRAFKATVDSESEQGLINKGKTTPWGSASWSVSRRQPAGRPQSKGSTSSLQSQGQGSPKSYDSSPPTRMNTAELEEHELKYTCKVSRVSASPSDAVLLAKLRFPPGGSDPMLYP